MSLKSIIISAIFIFFCSEVFPQAKIESVEFEGNDYFSATELENSMLLREGQDFAPKQLELDLASIRGKYKDAGFLFAKIGDKAYRYNPDSTYVDIDIKIDEGEQVKVGRIELTGNKKFSTTELLSLFGTRPGDVLDENKLNNDIKDVLTFYEANGFPFVKAVVNNVSLYDDKGRSALEIGIELTENLNIEIDEITIRGNDVTNDEVLIRELRLGENRYVTSETLLDIKRQLERLNIFEYVETPKIYTVKSTNKSGLLIEVREGNTNTFDGIIGYVPPPSDDKTGYFTGLVNLSFRNLFGTGRKINARWQQEVRETQELEFQYYEPFLFSYPVNIGAGFLQRIQDTTYTRRKFDLDAEYVISDKFTTSGLLGYDRVIPADVKNSAFIIADSRVLVTGIKLNYDNRNDVYFPTSGQLYTTYYSYGDKKIFNIDQLGPLGYKENYSIQKYSITLDNYFSFFKRTALIVKVFGGEVRADRLEDSDFFRIGGNRSIRGYRDEQFLASRLAYSNLEFRYSLSRRSFAFGFYDFGYYLRPADNVNNIPEQKGYLFGYGIGLRLETGLGLVGVSYALGKGDSFLDGKIHFGLVNDF